MLRRELLAGAVLSPVFPSIGSSRLEKAIKELEKALQAEEGISRYEIKFQPGSAVPLFVAAYADLPA